MQKIDCKISNLNKSLMLVKINNLIKKHKILLEIPMEKYMIQIKKFKFKLTNNILKIH